MLGQEDNHLQIGFFLKRFSLEISVLIISLEKMQNVYTWKFSFYIKADSKREVYLIWSNVLFCRMRKRSIRRLKRHSFI